jgi:hypothetical protein
MSPTREKSQLMSASEIDRTLVRLAHEILEKTTNPDELVFIGKGWLRRLKRSKAEKFRSARWTSSSIATIFLPWAISR